ncbi:MAG: tetratricopeptide repeat protein [Bacteroidota bacterium]|nr:tetratricopeptide repeat protein [Bacteroidota bacterium]
MKRDRHILQKYLDNELSEKELTRFEQELNASPELLVDMDLYKEVDEAIADTEVLDFRAQLTDLREETRRSETGKRVFRFTRPWHYAASAALALLVAIGLATVLGRPLSNNDLFAKYMKPYELVLTNRSIDSEVTTLLMSKAQEFFLKGDFEAAIEYFDEVLILNSNKMEADFYMGVSYMEIEQHQEASESFTRVIEHDDNLYIQKAEWYLAGCLLAMDETDLARRKFASIAQSSNHFYKDDAAKIIKRMKR